MVANEGDETSEATNATAHHDAPSAGDTASPDDGWRAQANADDGWRANAHRDAAANASRDAEDEEDAKAQRRRHGATDDGWRANTNADDGWRAKANADDGWRAKASPISSSCADTTVVGLPNDAARAYAGRQGRIRVVERGAEQLDGEAGS